MGLPARTFLPFALTVLVSVTSQVLAVIRILLLAGWALAVLPAPSVVGQRQYEQMMADRVHGDVGLYHAMLAAYARGDGASSVDALRTWTGDRVDRVLQLVKDSKDPVTWDRRRCGLAVMLHTDLALRLSPDGDTRASMRQLEIVTSLLAVFVRANPPEMRAVADHWFYTVTRYLRSRDSPYVVERLLSLGRAQFPESAVIFHESGTLAEARATDYVLADAETFLTTSRIFVFPIEDVMRRRTASLKDAVVWLRRAAELDGDNDQTQVHLGRVLSLRNEDAEAVQVLGGVRDRTKDAATAYVAALFIGGLRERQGDLAQSAAAYRSAIAHFPSGHAAYVGLSEVLQQSGQVDESRAVLDRLLAESLGPTREPLWWYQFDPLSVAEDRLNALRAQVRQ